MIWEGGEGFERVWSAREERVISMTGTVLLSYNILNYNFTSMFQFNIKFVKEEADLPNLQQNFPLKYLLF